MSRAALIEWWDALDARDFATWLQKARRCEHPDAQWLCSLLGADTTMDEAVQALKAQGDDPRSMYVRSWLTNDYAVLDRACNLGYAPAQVALALKLHPSDRLELAQKAAAQGHRAGMFLAGECMWRGRGCVEDRVRATALLQEAAELGHTIAQNMCAWRVYGDTQWQRYHWFGRAAARGYGPAITVLCREMPKWAKQFDEEGVSGRIMFELGLALKGHVDEAAGTLFLCDVAKDAIQGAATCVLLYDRWCAAARAAAECWIAVARRLAVVRDIRLLIARLVWAQRVEWSKSRMV